LNLGNKSGSWAAQLLPEISSLSIFLEAGFFIFSSTHFRTHTHTHTSQFDFTLSHTERRGEKSNFLAARRHKRMRRKLYTQQQQRRGAGEKKAYTQEQLPSESSCSIFGRRAQKSTCRAAYHRAVVVGAARPPFSFAPRIPSEKRKTSRVAQSVILGEPDGEHRAPACALNSLKCVVPLQSAS
jgi:hypothetical protein